MWVYKGIRGCGVKGIGLRGSSAETGDCGGITRQQAMVYLGVKSHHNGGSYLGGWGMYLGAPNTINGAWYWDIAGGQRKHCSNVELYSWA